MRWAGLVACTGVREVHKNLVGKSEEKRLLGRPRRRWEDNIKIDLEGIGYEYVSHIYVAQGRVRWLVVNTEMGLPFP